MTTDEFWALVEQARSAVPDATDADEVAAEAARILASRPEPEILGAERALTGLMHASYRTDLWAAACTINDGCSDDGFDYFRGWLIAQGRAVFERAVADPDSLAHVSAVQVAITDEEYLEGESMTALAWTAWELSTGDENLPDDEDDEPGGLPDLLDWFDFDDADEVARRLPALSALVEG